MYHIIKQCVAGVAIAAACGGAVAAPRPLPELGLADERELALGRESLVQNRQWILVVVDASRTLTPTLLSVLEREQGSWDDAVAVLVIGAEGALVGMKDVQDKLPGVRWFRSTDQRLAQRLGVPGMPSVLGIDARQQIVWQEPGMPRNRAELRRTIDEWTAPPVQENQVAPPQ